MRALIGAILDSNRAESAAKAAFQRYQRHQRTQRFSSDLPTQTPGGAGRLKRPS